MKDVIYIDGRMMKKSVDDYIRAATRSNTRLAYQSSIEHFEVHWGGFLPATADSVAKYLAHYADSLSINTLRQRLAALAAWHHDQGFPDPTKAPHVKKVLKGIAALHPHREKRARSLCINSLSTIITDIDRRLAASETSAKTWQLTRNKALFLVGFWRAFRSDELSRITVENVAAVPDRGMTIFLERSKTDRNLHGRRYRAPALQVLCPVAAYTDWIALAGLESGPVFRSINRWGQIADTALNPASIITIIRSVCESAGLSNSELFSSHSLRRGFANWANNQQWDMKSLMDYVGWKDVKSAIRYIDEADPFAQKTVALGDISMVTAIDITTNS